MTPVPSDRRNRYDENPYPPGTFAGANWDASHSLNKLWGVTVAEAQATARRVAKAGVSAQDLVRSWRRR